MERDGDRGVDEHLGPQRINAKWREGQGALPHSLSRLVGLSGLWQLIGPSTVQCSKEPFGEHQDARMGTHLESVGDAPDG